MSFHGSYAPEDVTFLLKPAEIGFVGVEEKERLIQSGARHYSEMISPEKVPEDAYMRLYDEALERNASRLHADIVTLAEMIVDHAGRHVTLVSLARAGTPIGVLLQRTMVRNGIDSRHYSVSIIRGRGIDMVAMEEIVRERGSDGIVFVDGWTGKGAITDELTRALEGTGIAPVLAVVADPAGRATIAATTDDYVIPSGILNGIVSGLISRTVLNDDVVKPGDYHACLHQTHLAEHDRSRAFIDAIESSVPAVTGAKWTAQAAKDARSVSSQVVIDIMVQHGVTDVNRVKPGIAEATRAILRRVPDAVHIRDIDDVDTLHVVHLAREGGVKINTLPSDCPYRAVTVIRTLGE